MLKTLGVIKVRKIRGSRPRDHGRVTGIRLDQIEPDPAAITGKPRIFPMIIVNATIQGVEQNGKEILPPDDCANERANRRADLRCEIARPASAAALSPSRSLASRCYQLTRRPEDAARTRDDECDDD